MSVADDFYRGVAGPSNLSNTRTRMLDFYVQHNDRTFHLKVSLQMLSGGRLQWSMIGYWII